MEISELKNTYFAACNSMNGFLCRFNEILFTDEIKRIFILKGGPGTGKSYFLHSLGTRAEKKGIPVEYFLCSSDTSSLDALLLPSLGCAVVDGTAPHTVEPKYPGAVEIIVNLGDFFSPEVLTKRAGEIISLTNKKSHSYRHAYTYLSCAGLLRTHCISLIEPFIDFSKTDNIVKREISSLTLTSGKERLRQIRAIGTHGEVEVSSLSQKATRRVGITELYGAGYAFMQALRQRLLKENAEFISSRDPLLPDRTDALLCGGVLYEVIPSPREEYDTTVNSARFIDTKKLRTVAEELKRTKRIASALTAEAIKHLSQAGETHSQIEKIYFDAMNFEAKEKFTEKFCSRLFDGDLGLT